MPDLSGLLGKRDFRTISASVRAVRAWGRIRDRATSIVVYRNETPLAAQTVRIEYNNSRAEGFREGAGVAAVKDAVIFGVKDHPTEDDTDLQKDDLITLSDGNYRIINVISVPGEIQATVERVS
jgi:hypothetical protein